MVDPGAPGTDRTAVSLWGTKTKEGETKLIPFRMNTRIERSIYDSLVQDNEEYRTTAMIRKTLMYDEALELFSKHPHLITEWLPYPKDNPKHLGKYQAALDISDGLFLLREVPFNPSFTDIL
jgi:hypothetical protein